MSTGVRDLNPCKFGTYCVRYFVKYNFVYFIVLKIFDCVSVLCFKQCI